MGLVKLFLVRKKRFLQNLSARAHRKSEIETSVEKKGVLFRIAPFSAQFPSILKRTYKT